MITTLGGVVIDGGEIVIVIVREMSCSLLQFLTFVPGGLSGDEHTSKAGQFTPLQHSPHCNRREAVCCHYCLGLSME